MLVNFHGFSFLASEFPPLEYAPGRSFVGEKVKPDHLFTNSLLSGSRCNYIPKDSRMKIAFVPSHGGPVLKTSPGSDDSSLESSNPKEYSVWLRK
jgi:hypothetical protein